MSVKIHSSLKEYHPAYVTRLLWIIVDSLIKLQQILVKSHGAVTL